MTKFAVAIIAALVLVAGNLDYASAITDEAFTKDALAGSWEVREGTRPADLGDCRPEDVISLSKNSGAYAPWRQFCYRGSNREYGTKSSPSRSRAR